MECKRFFSVGAILDIRYDQYHIYGEKGFSEYVWAIDRKLLRILRPALTILSLVKPFETSIGLDTRFLSVHGLYIFIYY